VAKSLEPYPETKIFSPKDLVNKYAVIITNGIEIIYAKNQYFFFVSIYFIGTIIKLPSIKPIVLLNKA